MGGNENPKGASELFFYTKMQPKKVPIKIKSRP